MGGSHTALKITAREREILCQIVEGKTNKQIAKKLLLSEATVKATLVRLCQKLGLSNRVSLAVASVRQGLVDEPERLP